MATGWGLECNAHVKKKPTKQLKDVYSKVYTFILWRPPVITFQLWHTLACTSRATCFHKISYYLKFYGVFVFGNSEGHTAYLCVFSNSCIGNANESPSSPLVPSTPQPNTRSPQWRRVSVWGFQVPETAWDLPTQWPLQFYNCLEPSAKELSLLSTAKEAYKSLVILILIFGSFIFFHLFVMVCTIYVPLQSSWTLKHAFLHTSQIFKQFPYQIP